MEKKIHVVEGGPLYLAAIMLVGAILDISAISALTSRTVTIFGGVLMFVLGTVFSIGCCLYWVKLGLCDYIYFGDNGIRYKDIVIAYSDMCVTAIYKKLPGITKYKYFVYFDNSYLEREDIVKSKKACMTLSYARLESLLKVYHKEVKIIPTSSRALLLDGMKSAIDNHNASLKK